MKFTHPLAFLVPNLTITDVQPHTESLTITACATTRLAHCPHCDMASHRVHSYYTRTPRDLPISGYVVQCSSGAALQQRTCGGSGDATKADPTRDVWSWEF